MVTVSVDRRRVFAIVIVRLVNNLASTGSQDARYHRDPMQRAVLVTEVAWPTIGRGCHARAEETVPLFCGFSAVPGKNLPK